jgi:hypothetical protein
MPTLPTGTLTSGQIAQGVANANPQNPIDANVQASLVSGTSGLTSSALNALLGFQNDITQEQQSATQAGSQQNVDALQATKAGAEATQYGLESQQAGAQANIYGLKVLADQQTAAGYGLQAEGYGQEEHAYDIAAGISAQNAVLANASGNLTRAVQQRQLFATVGSQRAQIAGAGFAGDSGSAMDLYRSSMAAGNLQLAQTDLQTSVNYGNYMASAQASKAESAAVATARQGALTAQQNAATAGQEDTEAQTSAQLSGQEDLAAQSSALASENTYNVAASTDAQTASQAAASRAASQVNLTNLVNSISKNGAGTDTSNPNNTTQAGVAGDMGYTSQAAMLQSMKAYA